MRDLGDADVGVGQHRLGSLDVVVGEFWRTTSGAVCAPGGARPAWVRSRIDTTLRSLVERVIASCAADANGLRDKAVLLLLARLGSAPAKSHSSGLPTLTGATGSSP